MNVKQLFPAISWILTVFIVRHSTTIVIGESRNYYDLLLSIFCFIGVWQSLNLIKHFFAWFNGRSGGN